MALNNIDPEQLKDTAPAALHQARLDIEYLRRWYAVATDALGQADDEAALAEGARIYRRIFAATAQMRVIDAGEQTLQASGPDGWAEVARKALKDYEATQHLIGSQVVDILELQSAGDQTIAGRANMTSYVQAWHAWPDRQMRLVLGTYSDELVFTPDVGWQIQDMTLTYVSGEERLLDQ